MSEESSQIESSGIPSLLFLTAELDRAKAFAEFLDSRNITCAVRDDAHDGIEYAIQSQPSIIVVDETLDGIPPRETGRILKAKLPHLPLIIWTGAESSEVARFCLERGGFDLSIRKDETPEMFLSQVCALLRTTQQIRHLMENNRRLNRLSVQDPLTGLYNHKHLLDWLHIEFKRSERNLEPLSCIMVDIDHFKSVNDNYGHKFGDYALKTFAMLFQENIRKIDIAGRYGGEEFFVILPNTDLHGAINLAEKLRKVVERHVFKDGVFEIELTASFGVASTSDERILRADHLLQMSDRALYISKESGRNRVSSTDEINARGEDEIYGGALKKFDTQKMSVHLLSLNAERRKELQNIIKYAGFQVIPAKSISEYLNNNRHLPSEFLVVDDSLTAAEMRKLESEFVKFNRQLNASMLLVPRKSADSETILEKLADNSFEVVLEDVLGGTLQSMVKIKKLEADLRENNTRLKIAQRKLIRSERLKSLGEISSGVAHDLNNTLGIILGRAQYLKNKKDPLALQKGLDVIEKTALDGAQTLRRILEFFRPEVPANLQPLQLKLICQKCLEYTKVRWSDEAHLKGMEYKIEIEIDPDFYILGSDSEICEVFTNLIFNALDAMPEGGALTLTSHTDGDDYYLSLQDTGIGMSREVLERIFDPFFTTKKEKGTGLGLSVVYHIITRHNGRIEVESKEGIGTTFYIYFPKYSGELKSVLSVVAAPEIREDEFKPAMKAQLNIEDLATVRGFSTLNILLVDDEPDILQVFFDILSESGYNVEMAEGGPRGLEMIHNKYFDVVITDLGMPTISGWEVSATAKEVNPDTTVVLTSGWGESYDEHILRKHGVDHVLPKPVGVQNLLNLIESIQNQQSKKQNVTGI